MAIPSMFAISREQREYAGESYNTIYIKDNVIKSVVVRVGDSNTLIIFLM